MNMLNPRELGETPDRTIPSQAIITMMEGVTTIPKGSRTQVSPKRVGTLIDRVQDIVCSLWEHRECYRQRVARNIKASRISGLCSIRLDAALWRNWLGVPVRAFTKQLLTMSRRVRLRVLAVIAATFSHNGRRSPADLRDFVGEPGVLNAKAVLPALSTEKQP
jgi:hypothetical protein